MIELFKKLSDFYQSDPTGAALFTVALLLLIPLGFIWLGGKIVGLQQKREDREAQDDTENNRVALGLVDITKDTQKRTDDLINSLNELTSALKATNANVSAAQLDEQARIKMREAALIREDERHRQMSEQVQKTNEQIEKTSEAIAGLATSFADRLQDVTTKSTTQVSETLAQEIAPVKEQMQVILQRLSDISSQLAIVAKGQTEGNAQVTELSSKLEQTNLELKRVLDTIPPAPVLAQENPPT